MTEGINGVDATITIGSSTDTTNGGICAEGQLSSGFHECSLTGDLVTLNSAGQMAVELMRAYTFPMMGSANLSTKNQFTW